MVQGAARALLADLAANGPPPGGIDLLIGSGRTIAAAPLPAQSMQLLLDGVRPVGIVQVAIDSAGALGPLGALRDDEIVEGLGTLRDDLLTPLGAAVVCQGGRSGHAAMRVIVNRVGWAPLGPIEVRPGQVEIVPLPRGQVAELEIELDPAVSLGAPRRARRLRATSAAAPWASCSTRATRRCSCRGAMTTAARCSARGATPFSVSPAAGPGDTVIEASLHRIHLPRGTSVSVRVGAEIRPDEVIGMRRGALAPVRVPVTGPLHRQPGEIEELLAVHPGDRVDADQPLALVEGGARCWPRSPAWSWPPRGATARCCLPRSVARSR